MGTGVIPNKTPDVNTKIADQVNEERKLIQDRLYTLYYHFKTSHPLSLVFQFKGTLPAAIERGQLHCRRCNYKFIKVRPFLVDLDEREKRLNEGAYGGENEQDL